ncbi:MAG TPA: hypothetical protein VIW29_17420 [Polyangiaceae bacterium]
MVFWRFAFLGAWLAGVFAACTRVEDAAPGPTVSAGGLGSAEGGQGGNDSAAGHGGEGQAGDAISSSGAPPTAELGLWPTFGSEGDGTDADAVLAGVSALAAGSGTLPIYVPWNELSTSTGSVRASSLARLDAITGPYREQGKKIALCLGIVDRTLPAWPLSGDLDVGEAAAAVERTIDELLARYGDALSHLCFGYEVDRYLATASVDESARLNELMEHAVARAQSAALPGLAVGVAVTLEAFASSAATLAEVRALQQGDEIVATYDPLHGDGSLKDPEAAADELSAALDLLPEVEGRRLPLALFEAGFPRVAETEESEQAQRAFFEAIFSTLDARTDELSFVGLFGLGDRALTSCDAEALAFGGSAELLATRSLARCSIGLRAVSGPRLAWPVAVSALSRYR